MQLGAEPGEFGIRIAEPEDAEAIASVNMCSFGHAFGERFPAAALASLDLAGQTDRWRGRLLPISGVQVFVAFHGEKVAGFVAGGAGRDEDPSEDVAGSSR